MYFKKAFFFLSQLLAEFEPLSHWATRSLFCHNCWDTPTGSEQYIKEAPGCWSIPGSPKAFGVQLTYFLWFQWLCCFCATIRAQAALLGLRALGLKSQPSLVSHVVVTVEDLPPSRSSATQQDIGLFNWKTHPFCPSSLVWGNKPPSLSLLVLGDTPAFPCLQVS